MKATGIVRRIDDLGRVVIPKEIRRVMQLRDGAPLEIFVGEEGSVIFRKFSAMSTLEEKAQQLAEAVYAAERTPVLVVDRERVLASAGGSVRGLVGRRITDALDAVLEERAASDKRVPLCEDSEHRSAFCAPIISQSELVGGVVVPDEGQTLPESVREAMRIAAMFFGSLLE